MSSLRSWLGSPTERACALLAGVAALPGLAGAATVVAFLADRPRGNGAVQFLAGLVVGLVSWMLVSLLFFRGFARVDGANADAYDALQNRLTELDARLEALPTDGSVPATARSNASRRMDTLRRALARDGVAASASQQWLRGSGYVNLSRQAHRAEEALLPFAGRARLAEIAEADRAGLAAVAFEGSDGWAARLQKALDAPEGNRAEALAAIVPNARRALNEYRDELWDRIVRLRNLLFATYVFTGIVAYAVLGLAVVARAPREAVVAGVAFYLAGAVVGLFSELYTTSRRKAGVVNDFGLATVRLLTIPLLSGIAGVGGVVVTRLAGTASGNVPTLSEIFSLAEYPYGLIVAAIFGLTPGLLLKQLRAERSKKELEKSTSGGGKGGSPAPQKPA